MIAPTKTAVVRCAIYTRVSTADQAEGDFSSLDNQRESAEAYIRSQKSNGWQVLPTRYDDGGYSGGTVERPALTKLLEDVEKGLIDTVVVYKVDRLSRSLVDFGRMMEVLDRHGVSFVSVTQQLDTSSSMGKLTLNILLSFAQFEREIIAERTRDKMIAARKKGRFIGGPPPLGYDVHPDGGRLSPNPAEAKRVKAIFKLYLERDTLTETLAELRQRGWKTKTWRTKRGHLRKGKDFQKGSLHRLLSNPLYVGMVSYDDTLYEGEHKPILKRKLWDQVQEKLSENASSGGSGAKDRYGYLLRGLLRCSACDSAMSPSTTTNRGRVYRYYTCGSAQRNGWDSCPTKSIPANEIERVIVERIRAIGQDPALVKETVRAAERQRREELKRLRADIQAAAREQKQLKEQEDKLLSVIVNGGTPARRAAEKIEELTQESVATQARTDGLEEQLDSLQAQHINPDDLAKALADFDGIWEVLLPQERRRVIQLLIQQIDYDGGTEELGITFQPTGIRTLVGETADLEEVPT